MIVVTGHNGFLGSRMVEYLKKRGEHTVQVGSDHDLRNYDDVLDLLENAEYVFHFAANMGGVGYFSKHEYQPFLDNMQIDLNILKACEELGVKRLFYASSACAYSPSLFPLKESMLEYSHQPDKLYGWEKLTITKVAAKAPFEVRVGILHTIYGEGQQHEGEKAKFPPALALKAIRAIRTDQLEVWGDGEQTRTFLHVDDAIQMMYEVMFATEYHGAVNISSTEQVKINQCVEWVCEYLNIKPAIVHNMEAPVGTYNRGADMSKFHQYYQYRQQISTKEGFCRLIDWMRREGIA